MKVLVCGGRHYSDKQELFRALNVLNDEHGIDCVIHGGASGADSLAGLWARTYGKPEEAYPADWKKYGRSAGPRRNLQMLTEGHPDMVVAFPGGRGTLNMIGAARSHNVTVCDPCGWM